MSEIPPPPAGGAAPLLPPDAGRDRPLLIVAAILVFLACVAGLGARGAWRTAERWTFDLDAALTIQIRPVDGRDIAEDAARAAEIARNTPGVADAVTGGREAAEALLAPWLGEGGLPPELPVPLLVDVTLTAGADPPVETLQAALDADGIAARVDNHARFSESIRRGARTAQTLGLSLLALAAGAAAAVIAFAARASLAARLDVADALHLAGGEDSFIASLFQARFFMLGLKAGLLGAFSAGVVYLLVAYGGTAGDMEYFLPRWVIAPFELALLLIAPLVAGLISALSARLAVASDLRARW